MALVKDGAGRYRPDIAPFAGVSEANTVQLDKLYHLLPEEGRVAVSFPGNISLDETKWKVQQRMECCQMVYEYPIDSFTTPQSSLIVPLTEEHVPQMLELTKLTKPGPFFEKTILFGNYFGIFMDGRLAAMTGQRMNPVPYMEVSAVCSHPDYRGRGYPRALMLHVMKGILDQSFIPFLHVLTSNSVAIRLYESIGFRVRTKLNIDVIRKVRGN